jgi:Cu-Zn family superoxide dismutase
MSKGMKLALSVVLLSSFTAVGCGGEDDASDGTPIGQSAGEFQVYTVQDNPAQGIKGSARAVDRGGGKMRLELNVSGVKPNTDFGAHLHKLACDDMSGGGHYQHNGFPMGGSATDPMYANATNEAWLDFKTDANGAGTAVATVDWVPSADKAKSIVVHVMKTGTGGVAGTKLACLPMSFK